MTLIIKTKSVYGVSKIYPANEVATMIAKIAGTATLTPQALGFAMEMGFPVQQVFGNEGNLHYMPINSVADIVPA